MMAPCVQFIALPPPIAPRAEFQRHLVAPRQMLTPGVIVSNGPPAGPQVMRPAWTNGTPSPWPTPIPASPRVSLTHSTRDVLEAPRSWCNGALPRQVTPPVPRGDALAQQLRLLQEAKSLAAHELLQSEKRIALRKAQLRQETLKAVRDSGLLEALKRWPCPASELLPRDEALPDTLPLPREHTAPDPRTEHGWETPPQPERNANSQELPEEDLELPATSSTLPAPLDPPPPPPPPPEPEPCRPRMSKSPSSSPRGRISPRRAAGASGVNPQLLEEAKHCGKALSRSIASQVSSRNLRELRKLQQVPAQVMKILEATAVLLGDSTANPMEVLSDALPRRLATLDVLRISTGQRSKVKALLKLPDVQPDAIAAVCHPCASLSQWCECIMMFLSRTASLMPLAKSVSPKAQSKSESPQESGHSESKGEGEEPLDNLERSKLLVEPDLSKLSQEELKAVRELTVTRQGIGSVIFHGLTDCSEVEVTRDIVLSKGFILVYPDPKKKPQAGCGLNKPATVTMFNCFPPGELLMDDPLVREDYKEKIRLMTEENKTCKFLDYDCQKGIWQFEVNRF